MQWTKICGFISIFFLIANEGRAQSLQYVKYNTHIAPFYKISSKDIRPVVKEQPKNLPSTLSIIAPDYYTQHFGFFCKKELAVEKFTKIPFRFRLGSLQQCNYYEGKK